MSICRLVRLRLPALADGAPIYGERATRDRDEARSGYSAGRSPATGSPRVGRPSGRGRPDALARAAGEGAGDGVAEAGHVDRLGQVLGKTGVEARAHVLLGAEPAHGDP